MLLNNDLLKFDALNSYILWGIIFFALLILIYSIKFMKGKPNPGQYYTYMILSVLASLAAASSNNLILLLAAWGSLGITLYILINLSGPCAAKTAKKTFIIVGGSDSLMVLGIAIIYYLTDTFQMDRIAIPLNSSSWLPALAYLCIAVACFAKAGAMPFHSWIPDCAENAEVPVTALLPASLDKLLGVYLLARISLNLFVMNNLMNMLLMLIGAYTIIAAVMMALVQHNMKRLLGYHAVSQVGYMVLGIGTGNPIGIAGSLFHMLNNAVYKSCLFLCSGSVEQKASTTDLDKLGGLAKVMPVTFTSFLIASLSISGIPPFNGFVSKWMVYQGIIFKWQEMKNEWSSLFYIICLVAAMFGSALTLASFMKLLHSVFLGQAGQKDLTKIREVSGFMWVPQAVLALICIVFGVFAFHIPLKYLIGPSIGNIDFLGLWVPRQATIFIIAGLLLGLLIYLIANMRKNSREDLPYVGASDISLEQRPTGSEFYNTVRDMGIFRNIYSKAEAGTFDIYVQIKKIVFSGSRFLGRLHNGILPNYLVWYLLGMVFMFLVLQR